MVIFLKYLLFAPLILIGTLLAYALNLWACRYLDADGSSITSWYELR